MWPSKSSDNTNIQAAPIGIGMLTLEAGKDALQNMNRVCGELKHHFDDLESLLTLNNDKQNTGQSKQILIDISQYLQSQKSQILEDGYSCLLDRLTRIYTQGLEQRNNQVFADTAVNYAGVIKIVSQNYSTYDYSEVVGLLVHYMSQLYKNGEKSWLHIFQHLLSMPDTVKGIHTLKERHLNGIQQWIEEGVDNLFELRDDQIQLYSEKIAELASAEERVEQKQRGMGVFHNSQVIPITWLKDKIELKALVKQRDLLIEDLENRQELVELLEQNMQEFEDKLYATRRDCLIHPV